MVVLCKSKLSDCRRGSVRNPCVLGTVAFHVLPPQVMPKKNRSDEIRTLNVVAETLASVI